MTKSVTLGPGAMVPLAQQGLCPIVSTTAAAFAAESKLDVKHFSDLASIKIMCVSMCVCVCYVCLCICVYKIWARSLISNIEQNACFKLRFNFGFFVNWKEPLF